jgi:ubiquinone/menaquinone biosynthesis C-methylase UbiE
MKKTGAKGDTYYGKVAKNYQIRRAKQGWWQVEQEEMASLLETLPKGLSVVDIPFGTGRFVPYYIDREFTIHGLDASVEMLITAQSTLGSDFKKCQVTTGSAMALDFADGQFDLLISTRFLRDIIVAKDAKLALAEFARVTKRYAIIQLGENTKEVGDQVDDDHTLESRLSSVENEKMLKDVDLRVIEKRLVKSDSDVASNIYHFLCEKFPNAD